MTRTKSKKSAVRTPKAKREPTIFDGEKYFDATFSEDEREMIRKRIMAETGFGADRLSAIRQCWNLLRDAGEEIAKTLNINPVPSDWKHIHVCRQLEIDYKSFAKNVPKLPIEPFYKWVEPLFPHFKPAKNAMRLDIQTNHIHLAFIDWVDAACPQNGCTKSHHEFSCWDRFERADYEEAARRIWAHNERRQKFAPPKLVYSRD